MSAVELRELEAVTEQTSPLPSPEPRFRPISPTLVSLAAFLSSAAAVWMASGIFRGWAPRIVALSGVALGAVVVALSHRSRRPAIVQYAALPAAVIVGALLILPDAVGGSANLPTLVREALASGGIAQPPVPFDPGWKFLLFVVSAALATAGASLSISSRRPRLGVFLPVPLMVAAAVVQPPEATILSSTVALALLLAAIGVAYGQELAAQGAATGGFEFRRLVRALALLTAVMTALVVLSQQGWLFPTRQREQVVPPRKPEAPQPQADRLLFTVKAPRPAPWRMGVLDVYDGRAWLLPPFDTRRLVDVAGDEELVGPRASEERQTATFTIADIQGHVIPSVASAVSVDFRGIDLRYDPRINTLRLADRRAFAGLTYTLEYSTPPSGSELAAAPSPPASMDEFLAVPVAPNEVVTLLTDAPSTNRWDRLQYVRTVFYQSVIAAGVGNPIDVTPERVAEILSGQEASPFEITAAEALLARWAGVPSRIGYGFYSGDASTSDPAQFSVRPKHGATWLEVYFEGHGWIPIVGVPPRARASLTRATVNPLIRPSDALALVVYIPVRLQSIQLIYVVIRYWAAILLPVIAALLAAWFIFPGALKILRSSLRARWGQTRGPKAAIAVSYAQMRDAASDIGVGDSSSTPLFFLARVGPDDEHTEFAWLVTRTLWGDLADSTSEDEADLAESLGRSVTTRLRRAQPLANRLVAFSSRTSLRDPYTREVPNLWPKWATKGLITGPARSMFARGFRILARAVKRVLPIGGVLLVLVVSAQACVRSDVSAPAVRVSLPDPLVPETISEYRFQAEPEADKQFARAGEVALIEGGRVFTVRRGDEALASLQISEFKPGFGASRTEVRRGVLRSFGATRFEATRIGNERMYVSSGSEQRFLLWFSPDGGWFQLMVARSSFQDADRIFAAILGFQRGEDAAAALGRAPKPPYDPRRGEGE